MGSLFWRMSVTWLQSALTRSVAIAWLLACVIRSVHYCSGMVTTWKSLVGITPGRSKSTQPLDIQPLLAALDWTLLCPDCGEEVRGDNPVTATRFTVDCACTTRVYQLAVA
jgi:hypothetical protein